MHRRDKLILLGIAILLTLGLMTLFWHPFNSGINREKIKLGLDLNGGAQLVYEADFSQLPADTDHSAAIKGIITVLEKRINAYGVSEPDIRKKGSNKILVEMPGIENIVEAKKLIGATALIKFKEQTSEKSDGAIFVPSTGTYWIPAMGTLKVKNAEGQEVDEPRELTSQYFKGKVEVIIPQSTNRPTITFGFNGEGSKLFEQITGRLIGKPLGIFLGDEYVSSPTVQSVITDSGEITGMQLGEAKRLVSLLNAGRIDVPLHIIEEHNVSATLGSDFVDRSKKAGIIGTLIIILLMILFYRVPGVVAGVALLMYAVFVMAVFKVWPVTLTLAGIAGFILSIGMAVDANVLIFERMKEELRGGRTLRAAIEIGFSRAWPAIRDSNVTTLITCGVLYWMGSTLAQPQLKGFALTLSIGVVLSMFSAIIVTRTLLRMLGGTRLMEKPALFMPKPKDIAAAKEGN